jgi:hypothetical protein
MPISSNCRLFLLIIASGTAKLSPRDPWLNNLTPLGKKYFETSDRQRVRNPLGSSDSAIGHGPVVRTDGRTLQQFVPTYERTGRIEYIPLIFFCVPLYKLWKNLHRPKSRKHCLHIHFDISLVALCYCNVALETAGTASIGSPNLLGVFYKLTSAFIPPVCHSINIHPNQCVEFQWKKNRNTQYLKCQYAFFSQCNRVPVVGGKIMVVTLCVCVEGGR